jgi:YebC/PmpR family DNA-binding regulatory protein
LSGHSKWSTIKHKKGALDKKRGNLFTKLTREIMVAARSGDPNPDMNFRLRLAVENAKTQNMPKGNIERAIARATGATGSDTLFEITYEAYGVNGTGIIIEVLTDNKNRAVSTVRAIVNRNSGSMANSGSVAWNFTRKGQIIVSVKDGDPDEIALEIVEAGAEDVDIQDGVISVEVPYDDFAKVRSKLEQMDAITIDSAEVVMMPNSLVELNETQAKQSLRLLNALEEEDDVQRVFTNADIPESILNEFADQ